MKKVLIIIMLSLTCGLNAQRLYHSQHLRFDNITIEDGLPGNSAHAFMQDRLGYLWMGTFNGLVRYDGVNFTVFKENPTENSLTGKFITSLFEDSTGKIWIGTMFHGLNSYEPQTGKFTHFPYDPEQDNSLTWSYVTSINEDEYGRIWVSTINGLNYLEKEPQTSEYKVHSFYPSLYSEKLIQHIYHNIENYPIIELAEVKNNVHLKKEFEVKEATLALIVYEGEYGGKGKLSDYGWITDENDANIWEADYEKSRQDGANYKKRLQIELQTLSPGQYQLNYKSDSDFCYGDFYYPNEVRPFDKVNRKESPEHDSLLWGIKVILLPQKEGKVIQELLETGHVSKEETIQNARIYTLFRDNESQLWIGSAGGLSQIQWSEHAPEAIRFKHFSPNENKGMGLQSDIITQIKQKDKNTLSIVGMSYDTDKTYGLTIENFKPKKEQFQTIYKNPEISNYTQILELPNNNIWVASFSDGLYSLKPSQNSKLPYPYTSQKQAMPNDFVWQLFQDKSGIAWAGTWQAGGFKLNSSVNIFPFYTIEEHTNTKKEDLAVTSVLEDSEENLWLGTRGIGLYKWDRKTHLFEHFTNKDGLIDGAIKCLKEDKKGNLWIGTSNGVNCYEPSSQKFRSYSHNKDSHHSSDRVQVLDIEEDKAGRIWLGSEQGLFLYQAEKDDFIKIPLAKNHPDLETEWVNKITFDNDGNLWLACYFEGIIKTKVDDLVSHLEFKEIERFYDVTDLDIIDVYIDKKDQLWLGDHQVGLQVMNISTKENYQYPREDKTKLNNVSVIADDEQGNLWLSNSTGLSVFNKTDKSFRTYTKNDGINFDFAKPGPIVRTRRGEFLLGGINGFYLFKPENVKAPEIPPNVVITDFKLFNQSLKVGENNVLKQHISYSEELNLTYEQNTIAISYAGLHFDKPKSIQYAYQLKGVDKKWMEVGEENIARYANLSPGSYSFKVKAANRGGDWSPKIAELKINISPPWWKTTWFYLLGFVLTSILFFYVYNVQLTRELERSEAKRLKDLDEMKSRFFVNVAHELRTPLTLILGPLSSITKRGGLDGRTFTDLKLMRSNGKLLLKLINEILELSRLEANKIELKEKPTLIYPLMHRSIAAFESGAQYRDIQLTFLADFDKRLQLLLDVSKFEKILFNLIINALKFTNKGGKVKITGEDLGHLIQIKIEDTGQGIHPEDLPRIFDRFYQSSRPNAIAQGGTGVGLALSKQFAQVLGGDLTVESVLGEGSTFIFTFPKNEVFGVAEEPKILEMEEVGEDTNDLDFNYQDGVASLVPTTETILSKPKPPKAHLLIVEDNPDMQIYIQSVVSENYNVSVVENGQEALDYMKKTEESNHLPSLIISDVMMPIMGGFSLLEKIKANEKWRSIPVIMLTARVEKEDRLRALRIGVDDYLTKPFVQDELLVRIANLLHNYHQRQAISKKSEKEWIEVLNPKEQLKQTVAKKKEITNKDDLEWLENLEKIMKAKVNDAQFTVSQLAYDLHISERQIYRKIKELTGLSPNKYLKEVRLQTARTLLENHDCSTVKEACYSVGFRKVSYFSKQFQERFGKLPSEFL